VWLCWLSLIMALYVLSIGPVMKISIQRNNSIPAPVMDSIIGFYTPLKWAYDKTLLHKPLGLYYHLWIPGSIDKNGNVIEKGEAPYRSVDSNKQAK
jgi:hypothetical protein